MTDGVLTIAELRKISGKHQPSAVERWLRQQGIAYKLSASGPWTTIDAVNASLGAGAAKAGNDDGYAADVA